MMQTPHQMARMSLTPSPTPDVVMTSRFYAAMSRLAHHASVYALSHDVPRGFRERVAEFDAALTEAHELAMRASQEFRASERVLGTGSAS